MPTKQHGPASAQLLARRHSPLWSAGIRTFREVTTNANGVVLKGCLLRRDLPTEHGKTLRRGDTVDIALQLTSIHERAAVQITTMSGERHAMDLAFRFQAHKHASQADDASAEQRTASNKTGTGAPRHDAKKDASHKGEGKVHKGEGKVHKGEGKVHKGEGKKSRGAHAGAAKIVE